jgi:HTH-type transcriptional regulator/antitoxin HigA
MNKPHDALPELAEAWSVLQRYAPLRPARNQEDFERLGALGHLLAESIGDDSTHPLYSLFELVMHLIQQWEDEHFVRPTVHPREVLRYFLESNDLTAADLSDIAPESTLSEILDGQGDITEELAERLAQRFRTDAAAFR